MLWSAAALRGAACSLGGSKLSGTTNPGAHACSEALEILKRALELFDSADAPADIGAHLDLAICRLEEHLEQARVERPRRSSVN